MDYLESVFSQYDVYFLATQPGTWIPDALFHENQAIRQIDIERLLEHDFAFRSARPTVSGSEWELSAQ